jgi:phage/plasmid-associated DNA primase
MTKLNKILKFQKSLLDLLNYDRRQKHINDILCKLHNDEIKFDENPYLIVFNNKIYDLKQGEFIDPKPDQYISLTSGYNFCKNVCGSIERNLPTPVLSDGSTNTLIFDIINFY